MTFEDAINEAQKNPYKIMPYKPSIITVYNKHKKLFNSIIEKCELGTEYNPFWVKENTSGDENLLYCIFVATFNIEWYRAINSKGQKSYSDLRKKVIEAHHVVESFSKESITIDFPEHENDSIRVLQDTINHSSKNIVIQTLRDYFNIGKLNATSYSKALKEHSESIEILKFTKEYNSK